MSVKKLFALDFEVYGKVQGVFFRKYTAKQARLLRLRGWCMNTEGGTVKGQLEGPEYELNQMKHWLQNEGSPTSRIDRAVFTEMLPIENCAFIEFCIKH